MKKLGKKLILNKKTIDLLDERALQNVKGGLADEYDTCMFRSCANGGGGGNTCFMYSCAAPSELG